MRHPKGAMSSERQRGICVGGEDMFTSRAPHSQIPRYARDDTALCPITQAGGEDSRQTGFDDGRLSLLRVVCNADKIRGHAPGVDDGEGCPWVAIAWLSDRTRVDQIPPAALESECRFAADVAAGHVTVSVRGKDHRQVRVTVQDDRRFRF